MLVFPVHFLRLTVSELQADHLQDLDDNEERVDVVVLEGVLVAEVGLPLILNEVFVAIFLASFVALS